MASNSYSTDIDYDKLLAVLEDIADHGGRADPAVCSMAARAIRALCLQCGPSLPHPDTARMDFMEGFIVEGSHLSSGKTAWLADVECLRECIDEGMRVVQERRDATGSPSKEQA